MRVLLVSDSHGRNQNMEKVIRKVSPVDLLIHLGDLEGSEGYLEAIAPCPVEMVAGNNDFFSRLPREKDVYKRQGVTGSEIIVAKSEYMLSRKAAIAPYVPVP